MSMHTSNKHTMQKACQMELHDFIDMLRLNCECIPCMKLIESLVQWNLVVIVSLIWWDCNKLSWLHLTILWLSERVLKAKCHQGWKENGWTKKNIDDIIWASLNGLGTHDMQWDCVFEISKDGKDRSVNCVWKRISFEILSIHPIVILVYFYLSLIS